MRCCAPSRTSPSQPRPTQASTGQNPTLPIIRLSFYCAAQEGDDVQFDADGLPVEGPARATPRSGRSARAGLGSSLGGSADALAAAAPTAAGGDLEAENRLLRSRLQAVESVSIQAECSMQCVESGTSLADGWLQEAGCPCGLSASAQRDVLDCCDCWAATRPPLCHPALCSQAAADALGELQAFASNAICPTLRHSPAFLAAGGCGRAGRA